MKEASRKKRVAISRRPRAAVLRRTRLQRRRNISRNGRRPSSPTSRSPVVGKTTKKLLNAHLQLPGPTFSNAARRRAQGTRGSQKLLRPCTLCH